MTSIRPVLQSIPLELGSTQAGQTNSLNQTFEEILNCDRAGARRNDQTFSFSGLGMFGIHSAELSHESNVFGKHASFDGAVGCRDGRDSSDAEVGLPQQCPPHATSAMRANHFEELATACVGESPTRSSTRDLRMETHLLGIARDISSGSTTHQLVVESTIDGIAGATPALTDVQPAEAEPESQSAPVPSKPNASPAKQNPISLIVVGSGDQLALTIRDALPGDLGELRRRLEETAAEFGLSVSDLHINGTQLSSQTHINVGGRHGGHHAG